MTLTCDQVNTDVLEIRSNEIHAAEGELNWPGKALETVVISYLRCNSILFRF